MSTRAGTSDPLDFRFHRALGGSSDTLKQGATLANGVAVTCVVPIAGALAVRLRGLFTAGGTMTFRYLYPASRRDPNTALSSQVYSSAVIPPAGNLTVVANTEFAQDITPNGESDLLITFTPSGAGAVTFFDGMQQ